MSQYVFNKPNQQNKLMDELIAQIPGLAPITPPGSIYPEAVFRLWTVGDNIYIDVNDGVPVTQAQLQAVIDAHINTPRPPSSTEVEFQQIRSLLTGTSTLTAAQVKQILKVYGKQLALLSKDD